MEKLRVLVAEDHETVRGILVGLLDPEFDVVAAVGDGEKLVESAIRFHPDVIISDILIPRKDGVAARKELQSRGIEVPFVFITLLDARLISDGPEKICYVHKCDVVGELGAGVRAAARGEVYHSQSFRERWAK